MPDEQDGGAGGLSEATRIAAEARALKAGMTLDQWVRQKAEDEVTFDGLAQRIAAVERMVMFHSFRLSLQGLGTPAARRRVATPSEVPHPDKVAAALAVGAEPGRKLRPRAAYPVLVRLAQSAADLFDGPVASLEYLETKRLVGAKTGLALVCEGRVAEVVAHLDKLRIKRAG